MTASSKAGVRRRTKQLNNLLRHFNQKFTSQYLLSLQQRAKWYTSNPNLEKGDVVIVKPSDFKSRAFWPLAKVLSVSMGRDGKVRSVTLRVASPGGETTKELRTAVQNVAPLEIPKQDPTKE